MFPYKFVARHLFHKLKEFMGVEQLANDKYLKQVVTAWLKSLAPGEYHAGI
jgi:hypothetical protein